LNPVNNDYWVVDFEVRSLPRKIRKIRNTKNRYRVGPDQCPRDDSREDPRDLLRDDLDLDLLPESPGRGKSPGPFLGPFIGPFIG